MPAADPPAADQPAADPTAAAPPPDRRSRAERAWRSGGELTDAAWDVVRHRRRLLVLPALATVALLAGVAALLGAGVALLAFGAPARGVLLTLLLVLALGLLRTLLHVAYAAGVEAGLEGGDARLWTAIGRALDAFQPALAWAAVGAPLSHLAPLVPDRDPDRPPPPPGRPTGLRAVPRDVARALAGLLAGASWRALVPVLLLRGAGPFAAARAARRLFDAGWDAHVAAAARTRGLRLGARLVTGVVPLAAGASLLAAGADGAAHAAGVVLTVAGALVLLASRVLDRALRAALGVLALRAAEAGEPAPAGAGATPPPAPPSPG